MLALLALVLPPDGAALNNLPEGLERRFESATGVSPEVQRRRLEWLARRHAITPPEAYSYSLLADGSSRRWEDFIFDREKGWNVAASGRHARAAARRLSDKLTTLTMLGSAGVPVAEAVATDPASAGGGMDVLRDALDRWGSAFAKPRQGAAGEGAFEVRIDADGGVRATNYQKPRDFEYAQQEIQDLLSSAPYILQPVQRSAPGSRPWPTPDVS